MSWRAGVPSGVVLARPPATGAPAVGAVVSVGTRTAWFCAPVEAVEDGGYVAAAHRLAGPDAVSVAGPTFGPSSDTFAPDDARFLRVPSLAYDKFCR